MDFVIPVRAAQNSDVPWDVSPIRRTLASAKESGYCREVAVGNEEVGGGREGDEV